jgi:DNA-binding HxlR family transcriptional regulator
VRSYGQYCAVAKSLDVIGDRWTMLVVRDLLVRGPSRYTELREGLPGIATNLLADRLRALEQAGVLEREEAPPPVATTLFKLTPRGEGLREVIDALGRWGVPYIAEGPAPGDHFRGRWLTWPTEMFLIDARPHEPPVTIALDAGEEPVLVEAADGEVRASVRGGDPPDAVLAGTPFEILCVLSGRVALADARAGGVRFEGDERALARLQPRDVFADLA